MAAVSHSHNLTGLARAMVNHGWLSETEAEAVWKRAAEADESFVTELIKGRRFKAGQVAEFYRRAGLEAPSPGEAAAALGADPKVVKGVVRFLVDGKRLARVGGKWVLHREVLDEIVVSLRGWGVEGFDVAAFKERFGLTRKLAIPILEWLDSERVTRREGERRRLVRPRSGTTPGA